MNLRHFFITACAVLLSGCAATGPIYQSAPKPKESDALIYIYRPNAFAFGARDSYFYVNDVNIVDLSNEGYTWFHLPAGEYTLKQKWPVDITFGGKTLEMKTKWLPGNKYYYRLKTDASSEYTGIKFRWQLAEVPAELAEIEIGACKLQPAFDIKNVVNQSKR